MRAAAAVLLAALCACGPADTRPNVVILLMDTMRPDRLGCYGYGRDTSPHVDRLASGGVRFERAYATADYTSAASASLFTGRHALSHGYINADHVLEEGNLTLAEILRAEGYRTAGFTANGLAGEKYQMDQGFDHFVERNRASAAQVADDISAFLAADDERPFFVYAHFMDVHDPYRIPTSQWGRFADVERFAHDMGDTLLYDRFIMGAWWETVQAWEDPATPRAAIDRYFSDYGDLYDAAIASWDEVVGNLLVRLDAAGNGRANLVVITADHGEQLLEHGYFGHANSGYDVGLRIPLVIHDPRLQDVPVVVEAPVSIADVLPTLLTRLGIPVPQAVEGRDRWPLVRGASDTGDTSAGGDSAAAGIYTAGTFMSNRPFDTLIQTFRLGRWKLILDRFRDTKELYDLDADPAEQHDLFAEEPEVVARLASRVRAQHARDLDAYTAQKRSALQRQAEKLRELRALGYLGGHRRGLADAAGQFLPMRPMMLSPYGPFGDEPDLAAFGDALDFTTGQVVWPQVLRGFSDTIGGGDERGRWFDRRSTFLLRNAARRPRIVFDVTVEPDPEGRWPTSVSAELNDEVTRTWTLEAPGEHRLETDLPAQLTDDEWFHAGLRANHRFVLQAADTPRLHLYAALRIRRVFLRN